MFEILLFIIRDFLETELEISLFEFSHLYFLKHLDYIFSTHIAEFLFEHESLRILNWSNLIKLMFEIKIFTGQHSYI